MYRGLISKFFKCGYFVLIFDKNVDCIMFRKIFENER